MGLSVYENLPSGQGELIEVRHLPLEIVPNESFVEAKESLDLLLREASSLAGRISTDDEYEKGILIQRDLLRFGKEVEKGISPAKDLLNSAKNKLMEYLHQLQDPAKQIADALAKETARYSQERERKRQEEEARLRREAEEKRRKEQRRVDMQALADELAAASFQAQSALDRNQVETQKEIVKATKSLLEKIDNLPDSIEDPVREATRVRQAVAAALQNEQARIAAERLRAEGKKAAASRLEKAAAKMEAPVVEQVRTEQVEAEPVITEDPGLKKVKGQHEKVRWVVDAVYDPDSVPREYLKVDVGAIQAYADRLKEMEPHVPGVRFKRTVKTIMHA